MSAFIAKFYETIIIILIGLTLVFLAAFCYESWQSNHYKTQLENANLKQKQSEDKIHSHYRAEAQEAEKTYMLALQQQQNEINQISAEYEDIKTKQNIKVQYVTKTIRELVDRPVYISNCTDDDGVSELNSLIKSRPAS